jgi:actin-related protein 8
LRIPLNPSPYQLRWPLKRQRFNDDFYTSRQELLSDIEVIWQEAILNELEIERADWKHCCVILIVPDLFQRDMIQEYLNLLLKSMGFKSVLIHQVLSLLNLVPKGQFTDLI